VIKWWTKKKHEPAATNADAQVESARTEIADMAGQASDRAAATIAAAVKDLKVEIEALFAQARQSVGLVVGPATADDEADGSSKAAASSGDEHLSLAEVPAEKLSLSDVPDSGDRSIASLSADPAGPRVR